MIYPSGLLTVWFSAHFILRHSMIFSQKLFALILTYCLYYHSVNFIRAELQLVARKTENKEKQKIPKQDLLNMVYILFSHNNLIIGKGYSRKKYLGEEEGKRYIFLWVVGADIFQIIYMGHWCLKKSDYMGGWVLSENWLLTIHRISNGMYLFQSKYRIPICLFFCCVKSSNLGIN